MKRFCQSTRVFALVAAALIVSGCDAKISTAIADAGAPRVRSDQRGTISGRVVISGPVPPAARQALPISLLKQCGESVVDQSVLSSPTGGLANAVVVIADEPPAPVPQGFVAPLIDQLHCLYQPAVIATRAGTRMKVRNSDALLHNVRADGAFNVAMPIQDQTIERPLPARAGPVAVRCDVHPWMRADLYLVDHDHYALTDAEGTFHLSDVEVGVRPITIWHARFAPQTATVAVTVGADSTIGVSFDAKLLKPR